MSRRSARRQGPNLEGLGRNPETLYQVLIMGIDPTAPLLPPFHHARSLDAAPLPLCCWLAEDSFCCLPHSPFQSGLQLAGLHRTPEPLRRVVRCMAPCIHAERSARGPDRTHAVGKSWPPTIPATVVHRHCCSSGHELRRTLLSTWWWCPRHARMIIMAGRHERERVRKESNAVTLTSSELGFLSSCSSQTSGHCFLLSFSLLHFLGAWPSRDGDPITGSQGTHGTNPDFDKVLQVHSSPSFFVQVSQRQPWKAI